MVVQVKGAQVLLYCVTIVIDLSKKLFHAGERAAADSLARNQSEEALDLTEPATVCGNEVQMPTRSSGQPGFTREQGLSF